MQSLEDKLHYVRLSIECDEDLELSKIYCNNEVSQLFQKQFFFNELICKYARTYYEPMTIENFTTKYFQHFKNYLLTVKNQNVLGYIGKIPYIKFDIDKIGDID